MQVPEATPAELAQLDRNAAEVARIDAMLHPQTLSSLANKPDVEHQHALTEALDFQLHASTLDNSGGPSEARPLAEGSTLANLSNKPTQENVQEWIHFFRAWSVVLGKVNAWKKKDSTLKQDILEWHYLELRSKYYKLVDSRDPRVVRNLQGPHRKFVTYMSMSRWFWSILQQAHDLQAPQLQNLALQVIGDYKKASLNPSGAHRRPGKGKGKGKGKGADGQEGTGAAAPAAPAASSGR